MMLFSWSRLGLILGSCLYIFSFNYLYVNVVFPIFGYEGFQYHPISQGYQLAAWILAILPSLWMPAILDRPSRVIHWFLYLAVVIPAIFVGLYTLDPATIFPFVLSIFGAFCLLETIYRVPLAKIPLIEIPMPAYAAAVGLLLVLMLVILGSRFGFHFNWVDLANVYQVRGEFNQATNNAAYLDYVVEWLGNAVLPVITANAVHRANSYLLAVAICGELLCYSITGYKSIIFSLLLIFLLRILLHSKGKRFGFYMTWGGALLMASSILAASYHSLVKYTALFSVRLIAAPGMLSAYYFDFFHRNLKAELGHSILHSLVKYPYPFDPPRMIGLIYFGSARADANAHIWADAYSNFGYSGILVFTLILGAILWVYDSVSITAGNRIIATLMLAVPAITLTNSGLLTTLWSHGMFLALVLVYLHPSEAGRARRAVAVPAAGGMEHMPSASIHR